MKRERTSKKKAKKKNCHKTNFGRTYSNFPEKFVFNFKPLMVG